MSKKKNTLKDLDDFLKQQAATLVTPPRLTEDQENVPPATEAKPISENIPAPATAKPLTEKLLEDLKQLSATDSNFRHKFYDMMISLFESQHYQAAEDKMLINTALYLKNGERWKEAIREYWKNRE